MTKTPLKKIHNPVTGKYYEIRQRSSKSTTRGQIKGLWSKFNMTTNTTEIIMTRTDENGKMPQECRDEMIVRIGNDLKRSKVASCGIFVDLPNGNKGMILVRVLDFQIKTGNLAPEKIVQSSYVVDLPEMEMAISEAGL